MAASSVANSISALIFVLGLIWLLSKFLQKSSIINPFLVKNNALKRLNIIEVKMIDPRNKLVLFERDNKEHLILINPEQSLLIESLEKKEIQQ